MNIVKNEFIRSITLTNYLDNTHDLESLLKGELRKHYTGICEGNIFIISIDEILEYGNITINKFATSRSEGSINVRFSVTGIKYEPGNIVFVSNSKKIKADNLLVGKLINTDNKYKVNIYIAYRVPNQKFMDFIKEEHIVPVIIQDNVYKLRKTYVACTGSLFTGVTKDREYIVKCNELTPDHFKLISPHCIEINDKLNKANKKDIEFFEKITKNKHDIKGKYLSFSDFVKLNDKGYKYNNHLLVTSSGLYEYKISDDDKESSEKDTKKEYVNDKLVSINKRPIYDNVTEEELIGMISFMTYNYNKFLYDCSTIYTGKVFTQHEMLFKLIAEINKDE